MFVRTFNNCKNAAIADTENLHLETDGRLRINVKISWKFTQFPKSKSAEELPTDMI